MNYKTAKKQWNKGMITITLPASWLSSLDIDGDAKNIRINSSNSGTENTLDLLDEDTIKLAKFAMKSVKSRFTSLMVEPKGDSEFFLTRLTKYQYFKSLFSNTFYRFRIFYFKPKAKDIWNGF